MAKDYTRTKEYRDLKKSLEDNLDARGLVEPIYKDMARRYLSCRETEYYAEREIREKGVNIWDPKRGSWQANPAISARDNAARGALTAYKALGFETEAKAAKSMDGGDDDEL